MWLAGISLAASPLANSLAGEAREVIGSLRNHDGDAEENVDQKVNLYFTFESRDILKSFSLFLTVQNISKLNMERSVKFEK